MATAKLRNGLLNLALNERYLATPGIPSMWYLWVTFE